VLPANPAAQPGDCDYATKQALGILPAVPVPHGPTHVGYSFPGTWGVWNVGPQCMAVNRSPNVWVQGVQWDTSAFLNPNPQHSYVEAVTEGVAEGLRLALPEHRPKIICGYSMGAEVVARFLDAWPADRHDEITAVITFGSPSRPPGPTKLGPDPGGQGISGFFTPEWARDREWSYTIDGDMYPESLGVMHLIYDLLTRMEVSLEFAQFLFTWLTGIPLTIGGILGAVTAPANGLGSQLLGLAGAQIPGFGMLKPILGMITPGALNQVNGPVSLPQILFNLPEIVVSLVGLLKFLFTNAHGKYWVDPIFEGMTAEDHAAATVSRLTA
jgi:pimeloyl-ACP methyl ester carboxylesterase